MPHVVADVGSAGGRRPLGRRCRRQAARAVGLFDATLAFITTPQHPCGVYQLAIANTGDNPSDAF